jgi:predicted nucleic acid-binding protein
MNATKFLDTNILRYAYDQETPAKRSATLRSFYLTDTKCLK